MPANDRSPEAAGAPRQRGDELCENCGFTFAGHVSNTGVIYPDWKPSGRFAVHPPAPPPVAAPEEGGAVHGVTFLLIRNGCVLMERCPKKRQVLGVGEWFIPGGKMEPGEAASDACRRELREELGVEPYGMRGLPIVEGSPVPPGPRGLFLMRPYVVDFDGEVPPATLDGGTPLRWVPIAEAIQSPVLQVRMMVAAAASQTDASSADSTARVPEGAAGQPPLTADYAAQVPGTYVPFAADEPFQLYPSNRPDSLTLDVDENGRITIATDATAEELRAALRMTAGAFVRVRRSVRSLETALADAKAEASEYEEAEAACCPEDVGFPEYIKALQAEVSRLTLARAQEAELRTRAVESAWKLMNGLIQDSASGDFGRALDQRVDQARAVVAALRSPTTETR